jgi:hypothetical protein
VQEGEVLVRTAGQLVEFRRGEGEGALDEGGDEALKDADAPVVAVGGDQEAEGAMGVGVRKGVERNERDII